MLDPARPVARAVGIARRRAAQARFLPVGLAAPPGAAPFVPPGHRARLLTAAMNRPSLATENQDRPVRQGENQRKGATPAPFLMARVWTRRVGYLIAAHRTAHRAMPA